MPKVTIIMPSLNVAQYIRPCMDSVRAQTLRDIEILAIDAGSEDGTWEILQEYAVVDERVRLVHSDRKSYGYQLNMGISLARGEYVGIVETDDRIAEDMFETLYRRAVETEADYVKGCAVSFMEVTPEITVSGRIIGTPSAEGLEKAVSPKNHPELFVTDRFLWMGIYRSRLIKAVRLNETMGAAFQDIGFMFQVVSSAGKAVYVDKDVYFYRQDNAGASSYNRKGFRYLVEEYAYVSRFLQGKAWAWHQAYYGKMFNQCLGRFRMMAASGAFWEEAAGDMETLRANLGQAVERGLFEPEKLGEPARELLLLFLESTAELYGYYADELRKKNASVCGLLAAVKHSPAVVFGCGGAGKFAHALLESRRPGLTAAYCDNNAELWNGRIQGINVFSPGEAVRRYPDAVYVLTGAKGAEDMRRQLCGLGIMEERTVVFRQTPDMMLLRMNGSPIE